MRSIRANNIMNMFARTVSSVYLQRFSCHSGGLIWRNEINISGKIGVRWQSSTDNFESQPLSENDVVQTDFVNRNPRNLEMMNIARKVRGWRFQYPNRYYYHRLVFISSDTHTEARLENVNGNKNVITASTKERAIRKYLHSSHDVSAAINIGSIIAERCKQGGITTMSILIPITWKFSDKFLAFHDAVMNSGISLIEEQILIPTYRPGIDYDNTEEVENLTERQARTARRGDYPRTRDNLLARRAIAKTSPLRWKNINRNCGLSTQGRLLGFHKIFHKHVKA